jgi:hypothetical protein
VAKEDIRLLDVIRAHRPAIGYSLDDLKGTSPTLCMHKLIWKKTPSLLLISNVVLTQSLRKW